MLRLILLLRTQGIQGLTPSAQPAAAPGQADAAPAAPQSPTAPQPTATCTAPFLTDLTGGDSGEEVRRVQVFLNTYAGASIPTTGFYGRQTSDALVKFQETYFDEILGPWNFSAGTGIWGPTSRAKANQLMGCTNT